MPVEPPAGLYGDAFGIHNINERITMNTWPFPPLTGAIPWTPAQIKEHQLAQLAQREEALL
jgi:hypothetical protein